MMSHLTKYLRWLQIQLFFVSGTLRVKREKFYFKSRSLFEWVSSSRDANRRSFNLSPLKTAKNV